MTSEEVNRIPGPSEMDAIRREALEFAGIGLYRYRFEGTVVFIDRGAMRILELDRLFPDPADLVGRNIAELIRYIGPTGFLRAQIREHGHVRDLEYPFHTLTGVEKVALHDSYLIRDAATGEEAIQVIIRDITVRKRAERALYEERERLAVTLASIGDGVITTDGDGRVHSLNGVAQELTGWREEEASGRPLVEVFRIINERTRMPCADPVQKVIRSGAVVGLANHTLLVARDGRERIIADSGAPIRRADGRVIGVVLVFRDVTDRERVTREMQRVEKLDSIGLLAGGIAHDFNNLLAAILGNISLARLHVAAGDPAAVLLGQAEKATLRAKDLTLQLLTFAKGGAPVRKPIDLGSLVRDSAGFALSGSKTRCTIDCADDLPAIDADAGQIGQVMHNLVLNAEQAMPRGGRIEIRCTPVRIAAGDAGPLPEGDYVRVTVRDEGIGIPAEHVAKIFDPYFTTKQKGSGLGLTVVHSIVKQHGGHIAAESSLGRGTTFTLFLPAAAAAEPAPAGDIPPRAAGRGRVLVLEDDESVRRVLIGMLEYLGYQAVETVHGAETLERIAAARTAGETFDLVVLDLTVSGGMGGVETLRALRDRGETVRAIASSGYADDPVLADPAAFGFAAAIAKPFNVVELGRALRQAAAPLAGDADPA